MCSLLTIQNRVSLAKSLYWSIVDKTLNMRHTNTTMNLERKKNTHTFYKRMQLLEAQFCSKITLK